MSSPVLLLCYLAYFARTDALIDETGEIDIEAKFNAMALQIQQLDQKVLGLQAQLASKLAGPIAFNAVLSKTLPVLGSHQHIVFDNAITNIGQAYSTTNGHFTAPIKGAYAFFVMVTNVPRHSVSAQLIRNGAAVGRVLAHGFTSDSGAYITSTLATMVELNVGDEIWVQNEYSYSTVEELDGGWSYFSGHLIGSM